MTALQKSLNTVAVRLSVIIGQAYWTGKDANQWNFAKLGRAKILENSHKMGITTPLTDTVSLPLGAGDVKMIDMAAVYSVFANGGRRAPPFAAVEIRNSNGDLIYRRDRDGPPLEQVIPADKIAEMNKADGSGGTGLNVGNVTAITAAYLLPGLGAQLATALNVSASVGTALASTAYQMSQGVDFDTAVKNATVNAITQSGSQDVAKEISGAVGKVGADAIASAGGSIASTLAKGGSADDAIKNAGAAIVASGVSSETDRAVGAAVGGAITGGATGAALGALGELGKPTPTDKGTQLASAGDITKDPGVVSDSPVTEIPPIEITAPRDNVQVVSPTQTQKPAPSRDQKIIDLISPPVTEIPDIVVTAPKIPEIVVTAPKSNVQTVSPDASVTSKEETPTKGTSTTKEDPNLFIYSSKSPLSQALKLGMGTGVSSSAGTTPGSEALGQALKTDAGDPLFGGKKKGKKSGWNVESLRYMGQEN